MPRRGEKKKATSTSRAWTRRAFLEQAALATLGLALPMSGLLGCGDDGEAVNASVPVPLDVDPNRPWWLQGNFAPVHNELTVFDLPVRGRIPPELDGLYVRNGSNPQRGDSPHWFFGDGMLHGVRIRNGRALWYRNRYVRTVLYEAGVGFGELPGPPTGGGNQSNVSVVYHAGRMLTSGEVGFPYLIDPQDLSTIGVYDFGGRLNTSFTAHPKIDPVTGEMHFFGYWFVPPYLTYHVAAADGRVIRSQEIRVRQATMIHSFAITERDAIFWECPVLFDLQAAIQGDKMPFRWRPEYGTRIGVMPLGGSANDIRWVEIPNCYVFHEVNAYREGDEIVLDVCWHDRMFAGEDLGETDQSVRRWYIGTGGAELTFREEIVTRRQIELPTHDRRFTGRKYRYGWFVDTGYHPHTVNLTGTAMVDYRTGDVRVWDPGPTRHANEAFFVPGGGGEGEGWLFTFVYDHATDTSDLVLLDAQRVERGPIAEIRMPRRVPHGFHGIWIPMG